MKKHCRSQSYHDLICTGPELLTFSNHRYRDMEDEMNRKNKELEESRDAIARLEKQLAETQVSKKQRIGQNC